MRAIVLPRVTGKTERMLRWLAADRRHVLIVHSARERDRLIKELTQPPRVQGELVHTRVVAISEVLRGATRGRWREEVYGIDELDHVLAQIVLGPVEVVSFTGSVEGPGEVGEPSWEYPQCAFCGANHSNPHEPGSCVMFWQQRADHFEKLVAKIEHEKRAPGI